MITRLIAFEVTPDEAGGFGAHSAEADLCSHGETMEAVRSKVREAVASHFFDQPGEYEVGMTLRLPEGHVERVVDQVRVG